jgi:AsmA family protein
MSAIKIIKWVSWGLIALVLGIVLTIRIIGWNWIKDFLQQKISTATGRNFTISGDLDIDLALNPCVRMEDVRLKNAPWDRFPNIAKAETVGLCIDLVEVLQGRIIIPELSIRKPVVHLARSAQAKPNWRLNPSPAPRAAAKTSKQRTQLPVIHQLIIDNGTITYQDYRRKRHLKVALLHKSWTRQTA